MPNRTQNRNPFQLPNFFPKELFPERQTLKFDCQNLAGDQPKEIDWLWPGRIPRGKITLITGDPCSGKTFLALDLAARVSRGATDWPETLDTNPEHLDPDIKEKATPPAPPEPEFAIDLPPEPEPTVLYINCEDDTHDTLLPRLQAAGANLEKIRISTGRAPNGDGNPSKSILDDLNQLDLLIQRSPFCRLIVIDKLETYWNIPTRNKQLILDFIYELTDLAAKYNIAVVATSNLPNSFNPKRFPSTWANATLVGALRSAWLLTNDPIDETRKLFVPLKNNLTDESAGFAFRIEDNKVNWESTIVGATPKEILAPQKEPEPKREAKIDRAGRFLLKQLKETTLPATEVTTMAQKIGISADALRRARDLLCTIHRVGFGPGSKSYWSLKPNPDWYPINPDMPDISDLLFSMSPNNPNGTGYVPFTIPMPKPDDGLPVQDSAYWKAWDAHHFPGYEFDKHGNIIKEPK